MRTIWNRLALIWRTDYAGNLRITGSGVAITSALALLTSPIISRIFDPEDYGIMGLYTNTLNSLQLLAGFMLPVAIIVEHNRLRLYKLLSTLKYIVVLCTSVLVLLIVIGHEYMQAFLNDNSNGFWLWLLPLGLLFAKVGEIATYLNVRAKDFGINAKINIVTSLINRIGVILLGSLIIANAWVLIAASLFSIIPTLLLQKKKQLRKVFAIPVKNKFLPEVLTYYRKYPLFMLPANLINSIGHSAPFFLLSGFVSPSVAGAYLLAENMLLFPYNLVSRTVRPVYLQRISTIIKTDHVKFVQITQHTTWLLFFAGLIPYSILTVFGVEIFVFVFGDKWEESGIVVQYMAFFILFRMCISPLSGIYQALKLEEYVLWMQVLLFCARVIPLAIGLYCFSFEIALLFFAIGSLLGYLAYYYQLTRVGKLPYFGIVVKQLVIFILITVFLWGLKSI